MLGWRSFHMWIVQALQVRTLHAYLAAVPHRATSLMENTPNGAQTGHNCEVFVTHLGTVGGRLGGYWGRGAVTGQHHWVATRHA